jgi:psiF repeat
MRLSAVAAAVCLSLSVAVAASPPQSAAAPAGTAPSATPAASGTPAAAPPSDAAAKHAKRTACLKDAKAKKLLGADKTSFLKTCIAAP